MVDEPIATEVSLVTDRADTFAEVYAAQLPGLVRFAGLLLGSSSVAEDVVQEAFAKLHPRIERIDNPAAWLHTVVVRACSNERRRWATARRHAARLARPDVTVDDPVDPIIEQVRRLPPRQRAVVVLRFYNDLAEAEIARLLGIRLGTVKSTLHRALSTLAKEVRP
jgi:RNA polymerase sigma-70 factor (sigma-E family)